MLKTFLQVNQQLARKMTFTCTLGFSVNSALVFGKFSMRNKCVWEKKGHIKLTFTTLVEGVAFWQQLLVWGYSAVPRGQIHFIRATPTSSSLQRQGKHLSNSPRHTTHMFRGVGLFCFNLYLWLPPSSTRLLNMLLDHSEIRALHDISHFWMDSLTYFSKTTNGKSVDVQIHKKESLVSL